MLEIVSQWLSPLFANLPAGNQSSSSAEEQKEAAKTLVSSIQHGAKIKNYDKVLAWKNSVGWKKLDEINRQTCIESVFREGCQRQINSGPSWLCETIRHLFCPQEGTADSDDVSSIAEKVERAMVQNQSESFAREVRKLVGEGNQQDAIDYAARYLKWHETWFGRKHTAFLEAEKRWKQLQRVLLPSEDIYQGRPSEPAHHTTLPTIGAQSSIVEDRVPQAPRLPSSQKTSGPHISPESDWVERVSKKMHLPPAAYTKAMDCINAGQSGDEDTISWVRKVLQLPFGVSRKELGLKTKQERFRTLENFDRYRLNSAQIAFSSMTEKQGDAQERSHHALDSRFSLFSNEELKEKNNSCGAKLTELGVFDKGIRERISTSVHVYFKTGLPESVFCIVGPPGAGKTRLIEEVFGQISNRPVFRIDLDTIRESRGLSGWPRTYKGATPGEICRALIETGCSDPIIFFDELDKVEERDGGAVSPVLQEIGQIIDPKRNGKFIDKWLGSEVPLDLSHVQFCFAANDLSKLVHVEGLHSRMGKILHMPPPSPEDMAEIVYSKIVSEEMNRLKIPFNSIFVSKSCCLHWTNGVLRKEENGALREVRSKVRGYLSRIDRDVTCEIIGPYPIFLDGPSPLASNNKNPYVIYEKGSIARLEAFKKLNARDNQKSFPNQHLLSQIFADLLSTEKT